MDSSTEGSEPAAGSDAAAAAAADELASMSLGGGSEPAPANVEDDMFCSNCGETDDLKGCNSCRCIRYCSAKCQKKHWKAHKKECKRIEAVLKEGEPHDGTNYLDLSEQVNDESGHWSGMFNEPPKNPDCDICMVCLPLEAVMSTYMPCCGKTICSACEFDHLNAIAKVNEKKAEKKQKLLPPLSCPFCRTPAPTSSQELLARMEKRIGLGDAKAMWMLALHYRDGAHGVARDKSKALEWFKKSADLGSRDAQFSLGCAYRDGIYRIGEVDDTKADRYFELAAKSGHGLARHQVGCNYEYMCKASMDKHEADAYAVLAIKHWQVSAAAGNTHSVTCLIDWFEPGLIRHQDLAASIRARDKARLEVKSESRDRYVAHLKRTGQFHKVPMEGFY